MKLYKGNAVNLIIWPPETKLLAFMTVGFLIGLLGGL